MHDARTRKEVFRKIAWFEQAGPVQRWGMESSSEGVEGASEVGKSRSLFKVLGEPEQREDCGGVQAKISAGTLLRKEGALLLGEIPLELHWKA